MAQTIYDQDVSGTTFTVPAELYYETGYTVTVTAVNSSGSSPDETKTFTTGNPPTPVTPTNLSPASGSTGAVQKPTFTWDSSEPEFEIEIYSDSGYTNLVESGTSTSNSWTATTALDWSTKYYWRVRAKHDYNDGSLSVYSTWATSDLTVKAIPVPAAPTVSGQLETANSFNFSWNSVTYASAYDVTITRASDSYVVFSNSNYSGTSVELTGQYYEDTFNISVKAKNSSGESAAGTASVATGAFPTPDLPTSLSPANGATAVAFKPTLSWTDNDTWYDYDVEVATDSGFSNIVEQGHPGTGSYTLTTQLSPDTTYYWRVRAKESYNDGTKTKYSAWTSTVSFTTDITIPAAPSVELTVVNTNELVVNYGAVPMADSYHIQIIREADNAVVADVDNVTSVSKSFTGMWYETSFHALVYAINSKGTSDAGVSTSKTTGTAPTPAVPTNLSPADGTTGTEPKPTLTWDDTADGYFVQISKSSTFDTIEVSSDELNTNSFTPGVDLDWSTKYYWRVSAKKYYNDGTLSKISAASTPISFTVKPIPVPGQVSDITITFVTPDTPKFDWPATQYADHYHIKITKP